MKFKGSKLELASFSVTGGTPLGDPVVEMRFLYVDPDTGLVHGETHHRVGLAELPKAARERMHNVVESLIGWGETAHFGATSQKKNKVDVRKAVGIMESLGKKDFDQA